LEILFSQFNVLERVISLCLKQNDIGPGSITNLSKVLARPFPGALTELRIVKCKISATLTTALIDAIAQQSNIRVLSLVDARITESALK